MRLQLRLHVAMQPVVVWQGALMMGREAAARQPLPDRLRSRTVPPTSRSAWQAKTVFVSLSLS